MKDYCYTKRRGDGVSSLVLYTSNPFIFPYLDLRFHFHCQKKIGDHHDVGVDHGGDGLSREERDGLLIRADCIFQNDGGWLVVCIRKRFFIF